MADAKVKCVLVGDPNVGKTCLLESYVNLHFPKASVPTTFENYTQVLLLDGRSIQLDLLDTSGCEDYDKLRWLSYPETGVVLMCFNLCYPTSFENVKQRWYPEIKHFLPRTPTLLVGTQYDVRKNVVSTRDHDAKSYVTTDEGRKLRKEIGARKYLECSSKTSLGVKVVFDEAVLAAFDPPPKPGCRCVVL